MYIYTYTYITKHLSDKPFIIIFILLSTSVWSLFICSGLLQLLHTNTTISVRFCIFLLLWDCLY